MASSKQTRGSQKQNSPEEISPLLLHMSCIVFPPLRNLLRLDPPSRQIRLSLPFLLSPLASLQPVSK